jgi:hypothetical protein
VRRHLTYANVMATVAVFLALGGGALAATKLARNSVGARQLQNGSVNGSKVADNSLTGADINAGTLGQVPRAGNASNSSLLGGLPAGAFQQQATWALVRDNGTILVQSGGVSLTDHSTTGGYFLDMGVPVVGRLLITTISDFNQGSGTTADPETCANPAPPDGGTCSVSGVPSAVLNDGKHVFVQTFDKADAHADAAFYIAVFG